MVGLLSKIAYASRGIIKCCLYGIMDTSQCDFLKEKTTEEYEITSHSRGLMSKDTYRPQRFL